MLMPTRSNLTHKLVDLMKAKGCVPFRRGYTTKAFRGLWVVFEDISGDTSGDISVEDISVVISFDSVINKATSASSNQTYFLNALDWLLVRATIIFAPTCY